VGIASGVGAGSGTSAGGGGIAASGGGGLASGAGAASAVGGCGGSGAGGVGFDSRSTTISTAIGSGARSGRDCDHNSAARTKPPCRATDAAPPHPKSRRRCIPGISSWEMPIASSLAAKASSSRASARLETLTRGALTAKSSFAGRPETEIALNSNAWFKMSPSVRHRTTAAGPGSTSADRRTARRPRRNWGSASCRRTCRRCNSGGRTRFRYPRKPADWR